jgi:hypothetical protein
LHLVVKAGDFMTATDLTWNITNGIIFAETIKILMAVLILKEIIMHCRNILRIVVLATLLFGVVACEEQAQKPAAPVVSQEPVVVESEPVVAVEPVSTPETQEDSSSPDDEVIISYGDKKLTMQHAEYLQPNADPATIKKMAEWWIKTQLLAEEAVKRGIPEEPAAKLKAKLMVRRTYAEALNKYVQNAVQITEEQMRDYYEKNKESDRRINEPAKLSFTHVASKTLEESQAIFDRVKTGADIVALAKELSIDYDKRKNGAVRNSTETNVDKRFGGEFLNAILYASEGEIIGPVKATLGMGKGERYEVARFEGKVAGGIKSFEEVKDYIEERLLQTEKKNAVGDMVKSLEEKAADKIFRSERILKVESTDQEPTRMQRRIRPGGGS